MPKIQLHWTQALLILHLIVCKSKSYTVPYKDQTTRKMDQILHLFTQITFSDGRIFFVC